MPELDELPPRRPMPSDVRRAARYRLQSDLQHRSGKGTVGMIGLALAVLAVPTVAAVVTTNSPTGIAPSSGRTNGEVRFMSPEEKFSARDGVPQDAAQRCSAAGGKEARQWLPLLTISARGDTVVAYRTAAGTRFCELTPQTVSLSAVAPAAQTDTAKVTYVSALGTVAGVVDPTLNAVSVLDAQTPFPMTEQGDPAVVRDGVFILPNTFRSSVGHLRLWVGATATSEATTLSIEAAELPPAVTPRTDRPQAVADRSTAAGRSLAGCLASMPVPPVVDSDAWVAGAALTLNANENIVLGRYDDMLAVCVRVGAPGAPGAPSVIVDDGGQSSGYRDTEASPNPFFFTRTSFYGFRGTADGASSSDTVAISGLTKDPRVATVSISRPQREPVTAAVVNGTFILPGIGLNEEKDVEDDFSRVTALDAQGRTLGSALIPT